MICPVKFANEMSGLSGVLNSSMTRCGHEADERSRSERIPALKSSAEAHDPRSPHPLSVQQRLLRVLLTTLTVLSMPQVSFEFL
jgi:hypothetical protein